MFKSRGVNKPLYRDNGMIRDKTKFTATSKAKVSKQGRLCPPGDTTQFLETFLVITGESATRIKWVMARVMACNGELPYPKCQLCQG